MYNIKIKLCGFTSLDDVKRIIQLPIDFVGFVVSRSKRKVDLDFVREACTLIPPHIRSVAVGVNETSEFWQELTTQTDIDLIQLHGNESPVFCQKLGHRVIKSFSVNDNQIKNINEYQQSVDFLLLDAPKVGSEVGGTGTSWNYQNIPLNIDRSKLFVAGGLNEHNIISALERVSSKGEPPYGVDVSSGIENAPGIKDLHKIRTFVQLVRAWELKT